MRTDSEILAIANEIKELSRVHMMAAIKRYSLTAEELTRASLLMDELTDKKRDARLELAMAAYSPPPCKTCIHFDRAGDFDRFCQPCAGNRRNRVNNWGPRK